MRLSRKVARARFSSNILSFIASLCLLLALGSAQTYAQSASSHPSPPQPSPPQLSPSHPSTAVASSASDPLVDAAFDHFYNMDYERSIQEFEKVLDRHPNDPAAVNHVLATTLMRELYRMGAMNTGEYSNDR